MIITKFFAIGNEEPKFLVSKYINISLFTGDKFIFDKIHYKIIDVTYDADQDCRIITLKQILLN